MDDKLIVIAGNCALESLDIAGQTAVELSQIAQDLGLDFYFKASYDKANRTQLDSYRGPGLAGLDTLRIIKQKYSVKICTDVHEPKDCPLVATVADIIQIPAFLCRQTDLLIAAAQTGKTVQVKKGQFLAPTDIPHVTKKLTANGCKDIILTERGTTFGYRDVVVDMRSLRLMAPYGKVIIDMTHPAPPPYGTDLARAAIATGFCNGVFLETHPNPKNALCDSDRQIPLNSVRGILASLKGIYENSRCYSS